MKKIITIAVAATMAMSLAAVTWAGPGACRGGGPRAQKGCMNVQRVLQDSALAEELGITQEQITTLKDYLYEHKQRAIKLQSDRQLAQLETARLLSADEPDTDAVMKAVEQVGQIEITIKKESLQQKMKVKSVLGKDTLGKIRDHFAKKSEEAREMGHPGGRQFGPGGGPGFRGGPGGFNPRGELDGEADPFMMQQEVGSLPQGELPMWMEEEMLPPPDEFMSFES